MHNHHEEGRSGEEFETGALSVVSIVVELLIGDRPGVEITGSELLDERILLFGGRIAGVEFLPVIPLATRLSLPDESLR